MNVTEKNLKLLEIAINEEQHFLQEHQSRVKFYSTMTSTFVAAIVTGFFNSTEDLHYYALIIGPVLIFVVSIIAIKGCFRLYQRFIEAIVIRAKLEQELGLTELNEIKDLPGYWRTEPIIGARHLESRNKFNTSREFVQIASKGGYHYWTRNLFIVFQILSVIMIIGLVLVPLLN